MKKLPALPALSAILLFATAFSAQAQVKIATVDMNKIFSSYYKTKDAETRINEARASAKKDLDDQMDGYKKKLETINKFNLELQKPELSQAAKDERSKKRDETINEAKTSEREITEFRQTREKQLQEQAVRMRNAIVDEISKLVQNE